MIIETEQETIKDSYLDKAVFAAGLELGISVEDIEEAYQGQWHSDEAFAENYAFELDLLPADAQWPTYCIDWTHAARELMYDFNEANGHYFNASY
jgi:antirestriction protein